MKILSLCLLFFAAGARADSLLVLIEPTARAHLGPLLYEWTAQVRSEGRFTRIWIREVPRLATFGGTAAARWALCNQMSNIIANLNPDAVQGIGATAAHVGGWHNVDGHYVRCSETDAPLQMTNWVFTDALDHGMGGGDVLASNVPGDGRWDETTATNFARPVARIDAALLFDSSSPTYPAGTHCLAGLKETPYQEEDFALRNYFTNDLAYRRGAWSLSNTGIVVGGNWDATDRDTYAAANSSVTWVQSQIAPIGAGSRVRFFMHCAANVDLPSIYDSNCVPVLCLVAVANRSFGMARYDIMGYGAPQTRWLFPGRQTTPYALVAMWDEGHNGSGGVPPFWRASNSDTHVADMHRTSYLARGNWPLFCTMLGDLTLPFSPVVGQPRRIQANSLSVGTVITP